jgi:hypothetical protein
MDDIIHSLVPFAVFGFPAAVAVAFRWFRHRERMAAQFAGPHPAALEARLARMEQALEAVAVEVDRMSEGQRFVTRLLADRAASGALPDVAPTQRGRVATPH